MEEIFFAFHDNNAVQTERSVLGFLIEMLKIRAFFIKMKKDLPLRSSKHYANKQRGGF